MSNYPEKTYPYCNPKPATRWLHYTIYINITLIILLVLFQFSRILFVNQVTFGTEEARTPIATLLNFLVIHKDYILAIYLVLYFINGVQFLNWMYMSNANIRSFNIEGIRYTPIAASFGIFLPILGLIMPYQAMIEIWVGSLSLTNHPKSSAIGIISVWWISFWFAGISNMISARFLDSYNKEIFGYIFMLIACALFITSALTLIKITRTISNAQPQYHAQQAAA